MAPLCQRLFLLLLTLLLLPLLLLLLLLPPLLLSQLLPFLSETPLRVGRGLRSLCLTFPACELFPFQLRGRLLECRRRTDADSVHHVIHKPPHHAQVLLAVHPPGRRQLATGDDKKL